MIKTIDLRSDTVTQPTQAMRDAMANAPVGDDVAGEDVTVNRLQEYAAQLMGKEAALFVPSGTMGNLISVMVHTPERKNEIILSKTAHIFVNEGGGYAHLAGVSANTLDTPGGVFDLDELEACIRPENVHYPITKLICMENTHNCSGGAVISMEHMAQVSSLAKRYGLSMHLDGARIFNAALVLGVKPREIAAYFDSVQFCLSKGLSAPVGSLIVGSSAFIEQAVHIRKMLGGGMRQAGILAAAGYVALTDMVDRLEEDHKTARILGEGLAQIPGISLDLAAVQTNMVYFNIRQLGLTAGPFLLMLKEKGVLAYDTGLYDIRFVTHRHISPEDAIEAVRLVAQAVGQA